MSMNEKKIIHIKIRSRNFYQKYYTMNIFTVCRINYFGLQRSTCPRVMSCINNRSMFKLFPLQGIVLHVKKSLPRISPAEKGQKRAIGRSGVCPNFFCGLLFTRMCYITQNYRLKMQFF